MCWLLDTVCVSCLIQAQLGITEAELKELISERERKVEEIHSSLREIKVSDVVSVRLQEESSLKDCIYLFSNTCTLFVCFVKIACYIVPGANQRAEIFS